MPKKKKGTQPKEEKVAPKSPVAEAKTPAPVPAQPNPVPSTPSTTSTEQPKKKEATKIPIIKGQPVSGKPWKNAIVKKRSSARKVDKPLRSAWELKQQRREELKDIKERERALKQAVSDKKRAQRELSEARKKMREENEKKSSVVQVITNTQKLKKMSRKQLRNIEKR